MYVEKNIKTKLYVKGNSSYFTPNNVKRKNVINVLDKIYE